MANFKYFTTLDLSNAYHQIELPEQFRDKLTITTMWGLYTYRRLVFGIKTAAPIFQALIDTNIQEANISGVFAYQDDIVICSNSFNETVSKLQSLLQIFIKYNLTVAPTKCSFHNTQINYLGFKIIDNKIYPTEANIQKITAFQWPNTKRQLKRFLGLYGYYRKLIHQ